MIWLVPRIKMGLINKIELKWQEGAISKMLR